MSIKKFHVITGLPRAGSTLLCNILNQNPKFWASSTSSLPGLLNGISNYWGSSIEVRSLLNTKPKDTQNRMEKATRALVSAWHEQADKRNIIFDKSRGWTHNALMLKQLYPNAKIIVCVRDLRNVFSSMEKQHRKNPLLNVEGTNLDRAIFNRADRAFSDNGVIGNPLLGIADIIRRKIPDVVYVQSEALTFDPEQVMRQLYKQLGEPYYKHDFKNIKDTSEDPDGFYLGKYPHEGSGEVKANNPHEFIEYVSKDILDLIMQKFQWYNQYFGYGRASVAPPTQPQAVGARPTLVASKPKKNKPKRKKKANKKAAKSKKKK